MFEIRSISGEIIVSGEAESFAKFVESNKSHLSGANLCWADLHVADLHGAILHGANLHGADLHGANIDYTCLPFKCTSLKAIVDDRIRIQYLYHADGMQGEVIDPDLKKLLSSRLFKKVANKFHRVEECGRL